MSESKDDPQGMSEGRASGEEALGAEGAGRRELLKKAAGAAMLAGLASGYGGLGLVAGRYLYPARPSERRWMFVARADQLRRGDSYLYRGPSGESINVTRQGDAGETSDFIALSSTCPHLGCQVHWEAQNDRYFCPCHNGTFDPEGSGTGGPPGDAGQVLPRYDLKVESGLLFIHVPVGDRVAARSSEDTGGDGSGCAECPSRTRRA